MIRAALEPYFTFTEGRPRRVSASSMKSSWTRVAVWTSSTLAAAVMAPGAKPLAVLGGQQQQGGPKPLALALPDVVADLPGQRAVTVGDAPELLVDLLQGGRDLLLQGDQLDAFAIHKSHGFQLSELMTPAPIRVVLVQIFAIAGRMSIPIVLIPFALPGCRQDGDQHRPDVQDDDRAGHHQLADHVRRRQQRQDL